MGADLKAKLSLSTADYDRARKHVKAGNAEMDFGFKELQGRLTQAFTAGFILEFGEKLLESAKHITNLSEQLDVSTVTAQTWDIALQENGQTAEKLALAITHIAEARKKALLGVEGGAAAKKAFSFFGVGGQALKDSPVEILRAISDQMSKTTRTTRELTELGTLMGPKIATSLRVTLGEGLSDIEEKYRHTAQVMSDTTIKQIRVMEGAWAALKRTASAEAGGWIIDAKTMAKMFVGSTPEGQAPIPTPKNIVRSLIDFVTGASGDPEGDAAVDERRKRLAEAQKKRAEKKQTQDEINEHAAELKTSSPHRLASHHEAATNLVRLGNFAFTRGGANPMETVLNRSMQIQQKIEANTRPNRAVGGGDSSVPQ